MGKSKCDDIPVGSRKNLGCSLKSLIGGGSKAPPTKRRNKQKEPSDMEDIYTSESVDESTSHEAYSAIVSDASESSAGTSSYDTSQSSPSSTEEKVRRLLKKRRKGKEKPTTKKKQMTSVSGVSGVFVSLGRVYFTKTGIRAFYTCKTTETPCVRSFASDDQVRTCSKSNMRKSKDPLGFRD